MVIKTELCNFSGMRIYPGHGRKMIRGDSKPFWFLNGRCHADFIMRRNPRKLSWTQLYRRLHKKGTLEEVAKRRTRKVVKVQRVVEGADLAAIKAKRNQKPEVRQAAREAAMREVKASKKSKKSSSSKGGKGRSRVNPDTKGSGQKKGAGKQNKRY